jgi:hypothetical protein
MWKTDGPHSRNHDSVRNSLALYDFRDIDINAMYRRSQFQEEVTLIGGPVLVVATEVSHSLVCPGTLFPSSAASN